MQVCSSFQTDNHASSPPLSFFCRPNVFLATQPTASKHWRHDTWYIIMIMVAKFVSYHTHSFQFDYCEHNQTVYISSTQKKSYFHELAQYNNSWIIQRGTTWLNTVTIHCNYSLQMSNLWHVYVTSCQSFVAEYCPIFILFPTLQHNLQQVSVTFKEMRILKSCTQTHKKIITNSQWYKMQSCHMETAEHWITSLLGTNVFSAMWHPKRRCFCLKS